MAADLGDASHVKDDVEVSTGPWTWVPHTSERTSLAVAAIQTLTQQDGARTHPIRRSARARSPADPTQWSRTGSFPGRFAVPESVIGHRSGAEVVRVSPCPSDRCRMRDDVGLSVLRWLSRWANPAGPDGAPPD